MTGSTEKPEKRRLPKTKTGFKFGRKKTEEKRAKGKNQTKAEEGKSKAHKLEKTKPERNRKSTDKRTKTKMLNANAMARVYAAAWQAPANRDAREELAGWAAARASISQQNQNKMTSKSEQHRIKAAILRKMQAELSGRDFEMTEAEWFPLYNRGAGRDVSGRDGYRQNPRQPPETWESIFEIPISSPARWDKAILKLRKEWEAKRGGSWEDCPFPLLTHAQLVPLVEYELSLEENDDQENGTVRGSDGSVASGNGDGDGTETENGAGGDGEDADDLVVEVEQIGEHNGGLNNCQSLSLVACQAVVGCLPGSLGEAGSPLVANDVIGWWAARLPSHPHPSG